MTMVFLLGGCSPKTEKAPASSAPAKTTQAAPQESTPPKKSQPLRLVHDSFVATSQDSLDILTRFCNEGNKDGVIRMIKRGEVFSVDQGTRVTIIDRGFMVHRIEINEGPKAGMRGYVAVEDVK